MSNHYFQS